MDGRRRSKDAIARRKKSPASKYDFVKVRVQLGKHFFVLSRFLVSRMLMAIKVRPSDATALTLELKKRLVDNGLLDVSYKEMEKHLFELMRTHGYGEEHVSLYRLLSHFHNERVPLIILICGTDFSGKSTLARLLAERLNAPAVLQTDVVLDVMRDIVVNGPPRLPLCVRDFRSNSELLSTYKTECGIVSRGLQSDLHKCIKEGKILIVEGFNLDPRWYEYLSRKKDTDKDKDDIQQTATATATVPLPGSELDLELDISLPSLGLEGNGDVHSKPWEFGKKTPTVVPFIVTLNPDELTRRVRHWLDCRLSGSETEVSLEKLGITSEERLNTVVSNLACIQEDLCQTAREIDIPIVEVNVGNLSVTLDTLHDSVLDRIKQIDQVSGSSDAQTGVLFEVTMS